MTEILFNDDKLASAVDVWAEEMGLASVDEETRSILTHTFKEGWSSCFQHNLSPAIELCLLIFRLEKLPRPRPDRNLVLTDEVLQGLVQKCKAIVGTIDEQDLNNAVTIEEVPSLPKRQSAVQQLKQAMEGMTDVERCVVFGELLVSFCPSCGRAQPASGCRCEDNE